MRGEVLQYYSKRIEIFNFTESEFGEKIDVQKHIEKEQLYVGLEDNIIVVIYALNQECDKEYENGNWKYRDESF